jgi:ATP-dependent Clp protease ATP-binding subunit ClpA
MQKISIHRRLLFGLARKLPSTDPGSPGDEMRATKSLILSTILTAACQFLVVYAANAQSAEYVNLPSNYKLRFEFSQNGPDKVHFSTYGGNAYNAEQTIFTGELRDIAVKDRLRFPVPSRIRTVKFPSDIYESFGFADSNRIYLPSYHFPDFSIPKPGNAYLEQISFTGLMRDKRYAAASVRLSDGKAATYIIRMSDLKVVVLRDEFYAGHIYSLATEDYFESASKGINSSSSLKIENLEATPSNESAAKSLIEASNRLRNDSIHTTNGEGSQSSAWQTVKDFVVDLADAYKSQSYQPPDSDTKEKIEQIFRNLVKNEVGSIKLLGPSGTGKTTLVKQFMAELLRGNGPPSLQDTVFLMLDASALEAGTKYVGTMDARLNAMLALSRERKIIWIIDEAHTLRGAGTSSNDSNDVLQKLKPGLSEGYFRMLAMSTEHEWHNAFKEDPALDQRFAEIKIKEPAGEQLRARLEGFANKYKFPVISKEGMDLIIQLSNEFNAEGAQPRKGTLLIEEIFADQKLKGQAHSPSVEEIRASAQRLYNLNSDHFDRAALKRKVLNLRKILDQNVIGQQYAKDEIHRSVLTVAAGLEDKSKPKGRLIFAGPRGQGKTEMVRATAQALDRPYERIVMTTFTNPNQTDDLKRQIAQALQHNALTVLFFDEIEKAHPSIQKDLLDLLDSGRFTVRTSASSNALSITVNARNAFVFIATNAGASYIDSLVDPTQYRQEEMAQAMTRDGLNELLLDRTDGIVPFHYLKREEYRRVIVLQIKQVVEATRQSRPDIKINFENLRGFIDQTVRDTYREQMSNREALMFISKNLRAKIAEVLFKSESNDIKIPLPGVRDQRLKSSAPRCTELFDGR